MKLPSLLRMLTLALAPVVLVACDDDDEDIIGPDEELGLTISPTLLTLAAGASETVAVNVIRDGVTGTVTVGAEDLPTGVTAASSTVSTGQDTTTLTFVADSSAEAGTTNVTIRASASGAEDATAQLALTITEAAAEGSFAFVAEADSLDLVRGTPDTVAVVITREGLFTGPVAFSAAGLPTGLTATWEADTVAGDTARVTFDADTAVAADTVYGVELTGSGENVDDYTDTLFVTVVEPASQSAALPIGPGAASLSTGTRVVVFTTRSAAEAALVRERSARPEKGITGLGPDRN